MTLLTEPPDNAVAPAVAAMTSVTPAATERVPQTSDWGEATDKALFELVNGKLVEKHVSAYSLWVATQLAARLSVWAREHRAGYVMTEAPLFDIFGRPNHGRRPDVCFVSRATLPALPATGELRVVPDLVVEVVSPNDLAEALECKLIEYTAAGVKLVWVIFPTIKTVRVQRLDGTLSMLNLTAALDGGDTLPGFTCAVADIFADA